MKKNHKITVGDILRLLLMIVVSLSLGFGLYNWNAKSLTGNALPMPLGVGIAVVLSGSMEPELSVDDVIFVAPADEYEVGDTVVYQSGRSLVVHKLIEDLGDGMVVTQGVANNAPDDPIEIEYIKGRVVFSIRGLGKIVSFIKSPAVTLFIAVLAIVLLILSYKKEKTEDQGGSSRADELRRQIEELKANSGEKESEK